MDLGQKQIKPTNKQNLLPRLLTELNFLLVYPGQLKSKV